MATSNNNQDGDIPRAEILLHHLSMNRELPRKIFRHRVTWGDSWSSNTFVEDIFPLLASRYLKDCAKEFGSCRLVCKNWNTAVIKTLENFSASSHSHVYKQEWQENFLHPPAEPRFNFYGALCNNAYEFRKTEDISKFTQHFQFTHSEKNPFHCHHTLIMFPPPECFPRNEILALEAIPKFSTFFKLYGSYLRYVDLELCSPFPVSPEVASSIYYGLQQWLSNSPNIEALRVKWTVVGLRLEEKFLPVLKEHVKLTPLPEMKKLRHLEIAGLAHPLVNSLLKTSGRHLERLKINSGLKQLTCMHFRKYGIHKIPMNNLTEVRIHLDQPELADLARLANAAHDQWTSLRKVCLDFHGQEKAKDSDWDPIFQCVNKFCPQTVTHLRIHFPELGDDPQTTFHFGYLVTRKWKIILPNVIEAVISFPPGSMASLDFLFPMKKLQSLHVCLWTNDYKEEKEMSGISDELLELTEEIQFNGYFDHMEGSNIWRHDRLPNLSRLVLEFTSSIREWRKEIIKGSAVIRRAPNPSVPTIGTGFMVLASKKWD